MRETIKGSLYTPENFKKYGYIGFTANSCIRADGTLVMNAGSADIIRSIFRDIDKAFGTAIKKRRNPKAFLISTLDNSKVFAFQTKFNFREKSSAALIKESIDELANWASANKNIKFAIPYPGISNGKLDRRFVDNLLEDLPSNVDIWEL